MNIKLMLVRSHGKIPCGRRRCRSDDIVTILVTVDVVWIGNQIY
jgi:hypothetical protein